MSLLLYLVVLCLEKLLIAMLIYILTPPCCDADFDVPWRQDASCLLFIKVVHTIYALFVEDDICFMLTRVLSLHCPHFCLCDNVSLSFFIRPSCQDLNTFKTTMQIKLLLKCL